MKRNAHNTCLLTPSNVQGTGRTIGVDYATIGQDKAGAFMVDINTGQGESITQQRTEMLQQMVDDAQRADRNTVSHFAEAAKLSKVFIVSYGPDRSHLISSKAFDRLKDAQSFIEVKLPRMVQTSHAYYKLERQDPKGHVSVFAGKDDIKSVALDQGLIGNNNKDKPTGRYIEKNEQAVLKLVKAYMVKEKGNSAGLNVNNITIPTRKDRDYYIDNAMTKLKKSRAVKNYNKVTGSFNAV